MSIFEETISILKSKVKVRELFKDLSASDTEKMIRRMESIYEEKLHSEQAKAAELEQKEKALKALLDQMKELGVTPEDIGSSMVKQKRNYTSRTRQRYVFAYQTSEGNERNWVGAVTGRTPSDFADYLKRTGKDRKECIIAEEGSADE
ncbi:H-NS family nucleoid-associated regulatory protein [Candidatus Sororendozoicomonas aggregata]|uniref:H-NS family histone-like protein n=1 Tax=Candidatus Sororendozoicomonas aggregata TaxID=3073239 RepID=UPI002ED4A322